MTAPIAQAQWPNFIEEFTHRNVSRTTRIEVWEEDSRGTEAEGLPLIGLDLDLKGKFAPQVEILLGDERPGTNARHMTHVIPHTRTIIPKLAADGRDEVLEIEDDQGGKTLLFFKDLPEIPA
ncbi:DUF5335 family protein [Anthocerotibacter panamensis]|uniref:DUF5335 family protein n=1 Tax=Anthocerotibacter panamensis TaxID=2857077 RepID=UPI001C4089EC|nr:DUF5335 family protein [Anthocerotibacter panamensis]